MPFGYNGRILHVDLTTRQLGSGDPARIFLSYVYGRISDGAVLHFERNA